MVIGDEILTPDSSRFWPALDYEVGRSQKSFDKQYIRDWIKSTGYDPESGTPIPDEVIQVTVSKYKEAFKHYSIVVFSCLRRIYGKISDRRPVELLQAQRLLAMHGYTSG